MLLVLHIKYTHTEKLQKLATVTRIGENWYMARTEFPVGYNSYPLLFCVFNIHDIYINYIYILHLFGHGMLLEKHHFQFVMNEWQD